MKMFKSITNCISNNNKTNKSIVNKMNVLLKNNTANRMFHTNTKNINEMYMKSIVNYNYKGFSNRNDLDKNDIENAGRVSLKRLFEKTKYKLNKEEELSR